MATLCSCVGVPPLHHFGAFCLFPTVSGLAPPALREDVEGALGFIRLVTKSFWPMGWRRHASDTFLSMSLFLLNCQRPKDVHDGNTKLCEKGSICERASAHPGNLTRHIRGNHRMLAPRVSTRGGELFNLRRSGSGEMYEGCTREMYKGCWRQCSGGGPGEHRLCLLTESVPRWRRR